MGDWDEESIGTVGDEVEKFMQEYLERFVEKFAEAVSDAIIADMQKRGDG